MTKREEIDQLRHDYSMLERRIDALEKRVFEMSPSVAGVSFHEAQEFVQQAWADKNNNLACSNDAD